jgi:hypothetical protein
VLDNINKGLVVLDESGLREVSDPELLNRTWGICLIGYQAHQRVFLIFSLVMNHLSYARS